jgi:hypothetical protein
MPFSCFSDAFGNRSHKIALLTNILQVHKDWMAFGAISEHGQHGRRKRFIFWKSE